MSDEKQEGEQQQENSNRPVAAATAATADFAARPPSTPSVRVTDQDSSPQPSQPAPEPHRATTQSQESDCIARQTSIRFRHSDADSFGDGSLSGGESSELLGDNGNEPPRIAGMEVMDSRPPQSSGVGEEHRDRALNQMETCSLVSNTSSHTGSHASSHNNSQVGTTSANGGDGGDDASSQASGKSDRSAKAPNHWHEADSLFSANTNDDDGEGEGEANKKTMSNLGIRKSTLDSVVVEGKFLLGESEQAYRSLQRLLNSDDHKKYTTAATNAATTTNINSGTSLKSFNSIHSNTSNNTGFKSAPPHPGYDRDSGSESSTGSSKLWDAMDASHASHNSMMSIYSTMTDESNPLTLERRRRMERRIMYVRRCAKAMAGFVALAVLSMSAIYLITEDHHHPDRNESSSVVEESHPHGHGDDDRMLDEVPPSHPWIPPDHNDKEGEDQATWSSPGQEENDQAWSSPGNQEEDFYQAWPELFEQQQQENDLATWSHSLPGKRDEDDAGFRYYMNDPMEVITPQERTRREREARERAREARLKEQEQREMEREQKRNNNGQVTVTPRDRTLGGGEGRAVPPSQGRQQQDGIPRLTLNERREERMRAREERLKEQEQRLLERDQKRNGQLTVTPQQEQDHRRAQETIAPQDPLAPRAGQEPLVLPQEQRARMTEEEQLDFFINMDVAAQYDVVERITPQELTRQARVERELAREQRNNQLGMTPQELTRRAREERELARERRDQLGITPQELAGRAREERLLAQQQQQQQVQMQPEGPEDRARREELAILREMGAI
mmetsp:Transcript_36443/g.76500  ORF Transcript_36443/g.76500 Transcript_36443/m.76500 type:complete len:790 (-) Transcript_36443:119-2488(-)